MPGAVVVAHTVCTHMHLSKGEGAAHGKGSWLTKGASTSFPAIVRQSAHTTAKNISHPTRSLEYRVCLYV